MIDIHSHILPRFDDGAVNEEESIAMAREAVRQGITTIVASPHHRNGKYNNNRTEVLNHTEIMNQLFVQEGIPLKVLPAQEVRIFGELLEEYEAGDVLSINDDGKYMLIEFPSASVPRYAEKLLTDLQFERITPIIVHPERNQELMENPSLLYNLVKKGCITQVTAASVAGMFGKKVQKFTFSLIEANLTHLIASDAHNLSSRSFYMDVAFNTIEKKYGYDTVDLFLSNAEAVVNGKGITKDMPERIKTKKFLGIF